MKRWLTICVCVLGIGLQSHAAESLKPVPLGSMAQIAIGLIPPFNITVPIQPEITGEIELLKVLRKHQISKVKSAYEMRCLPVGSCAFPFIVIVERPEIKKLPPDCVLAKGDVVVLKLVRKGYSAELVTVCLDRGSINDQIKVRTIDGKQRFKATVIGPRLVISEL